MSLFDKILTDPELIAKPPVLVDIGASGAIHKSWKKIARYSICIAFDADSRDFAHSTTAGGSYRALHTFNCIVSDRDDAKIPFYLTKYPHCSSTLTPDMESLKDWSYASYFEIEKQIELNNKNLSSILKELSIGYVDWFKTDSQGLDLRLFKCLGDINRKTLVAEFEPGIIAAYHGEDKMHSILAWMESQKNFWLSKLIVKGAPRINGASYEKMYPSARTRKFGMALLTQSAGWGEMTYVNTFADAQFTRRDYLLGWVFATIEEQHAFAFELAQKGKEKFKDTIFDELTSSSKSKMSSSIWFNSKWFPLAWQKMKRAINK